MTVDHYGVPFSTIEPGEIDQEQHDGVRDVFFVSHATMLVRADLFRELGGFDLGAAPGSDDVDLCWRARLAGARVLVAPAARVRHRRATAVEHRRTRRQSPREARDATHARVRMLYKSYAAGALWWVLPTGFLLTIAEAIGLVLTRRARQGGAVIAGWMPARGAGGDLRRARADTQRLPRDRRRRRPRPHGAGQRADSQLPRPAPACRRPVGVRVERRARAHGADARPGCARLRLHC